MTEETIAGITRQKDLLAQQKSAFPVLRDNCFVSALAHTLLQGPVDALAQVVDKTTGSNFLPGLQFMPEARVAEFASFDWFQQQLGGALGALPFLLTLHQGSRAWLSGTMLRADTRMMLSAGVRLGESGTRELARLELVGAGMTGMAYGGLLTPLPTEELSTNGRFTGSKLRNAAVNSLTFLALTGSRLGYRALAESMNPGLLKIVPGSEIGMGVLSGLQGGLTNVLSDSLLRGQGLTLRKDAPSTMLGFALIGTLVPGGQNAIRSVVARFKTTPPASEVTPIEKVSRSDAAQLIEPGSTPAVKSIESVFNAGELKIINRWKEAQAGLVETRLRETQPQTIKQLADEAYGKGAPVKERKLHILLGNCGAGKSRITNALSEELGAMTPDSDQIKAKIPGYDGGLGNQAVHEDSSAAYKILLDRALQNGDNTVWQGVGKTARSITDLISQARSHGYQVTVHLVDAPPEIAARRVFHRANQAPDSFTGVRQMIPPEVPLDPRYQYVPRINFFKLIGEAAQNSRAGQERTIDGFRLWRSTDAQSSWLPTAGTVSNLRHFGVPARRTDDQLENNISRLRHTEKRAL